LRLLRHDRVRLMAGYAYQRRMNTEPPKGDPGTWGTKADPLLVSILGWNQLHPFIKERMRHAHLLNGYCIRNQFGPPCSEGLPYPWAIECEFETSCERPAVHYDEDDRTWVCGVHR